MKLGSYTYPASSIKVIKVESWFKVKDPQRARVTDLPSLTHYKCVSHSLWTHLAHGDEKNYVVISGLASQTNFLGRKKDSLVKLHRPSYLCTLSNNQLGWGMIDKSNVRKVCTLFILSEDCNCTVWLRWRMPGIWWCFAHACHKTFGKSKQDNLWSLTRLPFFLHPKKVSLASETIYWCLSLILNTLSFSPYTLLMHFTSFQWLDLDSSAG